MFQTTAVMILETLMCLSVASPADPAVQMVVDYKRAMGACLEVRKYVVK